jgi:hypothetical protein
MGGEVHSVSASCVHHGRLCECSRCKRGCLTPSGTHGWTHDEVGEKRRGNERLFHESAQPRTQGRRSAMSLLKTASCSARSSCFLIAVAPSSTMVPEYNQLNNRESLAARLEEITLHPGCT